MGSIEIRAFPRSDAAFNDAVMDVVDELAPTDPTVLETMLRLRYPRARVTVQSPLASVGDTPLWYVFRDGHAVSLAAGDLEPSSLAANEASR